MDSASSRGAVLLVERKLIQFGAGLNRPGGGRVAGGVFNQRCSDANREFTQMKHTHEGFRSLAVELSELHNHLGRVASAAAFAESSLDEGPQPSVNDLRLREIHRLRLNRNRLFGSDLFADPAWDMLLDLYAAHLSNELNSVTSLCLASGVPPSTALRWISKLESGQWVFREPDQADRRRFYIRLSPKGLEAMERVFARPLFAFFH